MSQSNIQIKNNLPYVIALKSTILSKKEKKYYNTLSNKFEPTKLYYNRYGYDDISIKVQILRIIIKDEIFGSAIIKIIKEGKKKMEETELLFKNQDMVKINYRGYNDKRGKFINKLTIGEDSIYKYKPEIEPEINLSKIKDIFLVSDKLEKRIPGLIDNFKTLLKTDQIINSYNTDSVFITDELTIIGNNIIGTSANIKLFREQCSPNLIKILNLIDINFVIQGGNLLQFKNQVFHGQTVIGMYLEKRGLLMYDNLCKDTSKKLEQILNNKSDNKLSNKYNCYDIYLCKELQQARVDLLNHYNNSAIKVDNKWVELSDPKYKNRLEYITLLTRNYYHLDMFTLKVGNKVFILNSKILEPNSYLNLINQAKKVGIKIIDLEYNWLKPVSINGIEISDTSIVIGKIPEIIKKKIEKENIIVNIIEKSTTGKHNSAGIHCLINKLKINTN